MSALIPYYDWLKAGHVIFVIFWMAGMFMLPRYFAYHCEAEPGSAESEPMTLNMPTSAKAQ